MAYQNQKPKTQKPKTQKPKRCLRADSLPCNLSKLAAFLLSGSSNKKFATLNWLFNVAQRDLRILKQGNWKIQKWSVITPFHSVACFYDHYHDVARQFLSVHTLLRSHQFNVLGGRVDWLWNPPASSSLRFFFSLRMCINVCNDRKLALEWSQPVSQSVTHSVVTRPAKLKVLSPAWHTIISLIPSRLSRWVNDSVCICDSVNPVSCNWSRCDKYLYKKTEPQYR